MSDHGEAYGSLGAPISRSLVPHACMQQAGEIVIKWFQMLHASLV